MVPNLEQKELSDKRPGKLEGTGQKTYFDTSLSTKDGAAVLSRVRARLFSQSQLPV